MDYINLIVALAALVSAGAAGNGNCLLFGLLIKLER